MVYVFCCDLLHSEAIFPQFTFESYLKSYKQYFAKLYCIYEEYLSIASSFLDNKTYTSYFSIGKLKIANH